MNEPVTKSARRPRSTEEALSELQREMQVREHCYDRWVSEGRLTRIDAVDRLDRLMTAMALLETKLSLEQANSPAPRV